MSASQIRADVVANTGPLVEDEKFRAVFRLLPACVAVLVAEGGGGQTVSLTCTSAVPLSRVPPLVGVAVGTQTTIAALLDPGHAFSVNFLSHGADEVSELFAGGHPPPSAARRPHHRAAVAVRTGVPSLAAGTVAVLVCSVVACEPTGDHLFVVGAIRAARFQADEVPLLYGMAGYGQFLPNDKRLTEG